MSKEVYWHLPGFAYYYYLNQLVILAMGDQPEKFRDGYRVGSVYGTFPGAIWNGGRAVFGIAAKNDIRRMLDKYEELGVPVRFTWTNSLIGEQHLNDTYCNMIMQMADNGKNQVLVNTEILEDYLRSKYPNFKFISSTTKRISDPGELGCEMKKDYFMVVLDYDLNHNEDVLRSLEPDAGRIEILVDEVCFPGCKMRRDHYRDESLAQLSFDRDSHFNCPNRKTKPSFAEAMKRPSFISNKEINAYIDRGFVNYKLVGRGLPMSLVIDSYVYYLVKEEYQDEMKKFFYDCIEKNYGSQYIKQMG